uniref:META domain-containing protein n=1 Tax=Acinetobacter baumannii TaxID=470 RepID=UPI000AC66172
TGCNRVFGRYTCDFRQKKLDGEVNVVHSSCDGALTQEAKFVESLQRIKRLQLVGNILYLLDKCGQRLIKVEKK